MRRLPARFELPLFALLLSGLMSLLVSGVATLNAVGPVAGFTRLSLLSQARRVGRLFAGIAQHAARSSTGTATVCSRPGSAVSSSPCLCATRLAIPGASSDPLMRRPRA